MADTYMRYVNGLLTDSLSFGKFIESNQIAVQRISNCMNPSKHARSKPRSQGAKDLDFKEQLSDFSPKISGRRSSKINRSYDIKPFENEKNKQIQAGSPRISKDIPKDARQMDAMISPRSHSSAKADSKKPTQYPVSSKDKFELVALQSRREHGAQQERFRKMRAATNESRCKEMKSLIMISGKGRHPRPQLPE